MHRDHIYDSLMEPNENYDELTKQLLETIFGSFSVITKRMLADHLKDGKLDKANENLYSELEVVQQLMSFLKVTLEFLID